MVSDKKEINGQEDDGQEVQRQKSSEEELLEGEQDFFNQILKEVEQQEDRNNIFIEYRTIYNHGVMAGDSARFESIKIKETEEKKSKQEFESVLTNEKQFCNWLINNYETYSMALMIASAVFECMPYMWVQQAADTLYSTFENEQEERKYGVSDIFNQFGAEICQGEMNTYTGKTLVEIVHFVKGEYRERILKYIWRECPQMHDKIVLWLKKFSMQKPMSMSQRVSLIMGQLACWDYYYFQHNLIAMIPHDKKISTDMLMAQIVVMLSEHSEYQGNVHNLMAFWNRESNIHYLLTNLFICAETKDKSDILEKAIHRYVQEAIKAIREQRENEWMQNIYNFFASGMRAFTFYRILIDKIYEMVCDKISIREKRDVCNLFLRLFSVDIFLTRFDAGEDAIFVKLCMTGHEISYKICYLWQMVWQCRYYRQAFYGLMVKYDEYAQKAGNKCNLEIFLKKALGDVCTEEMQRDICYKVHRRSENE